MILLKSRRFFGLRGSFDFCPILFFCIIPKTNLPFLACNVGALLSCRTRFKHLIYFSTFLPRRTRTSLSPPHTPNCHVLPAIFVTRNPHNIVMLNSFQHLFFLSMPTYTTLSSLHTPNCHAELVSASRIFCKLRQADK